MSPWQTLVDHVEKHLDFIYKDIDLSISTAELTQSILAIMRLQQVDTAPEQFVNLWDQSDAIMITYGDSFLSDDEKPLDNLKHFLDEYCAGAINMVHILPFFPYSSDDGFSVIDFSSVNESLGDWTHIQAIAEDYQLMADLVINHCSSRGKWFDNFQKQIDPGKDFFFTCEPGDDISQVVRPRTNRLLFPVDTSAGIKYVWCTFSHDQVDLDFRNPEVLKKFIEIIRLYLDMGVRIFRLDAIAFLWKKVGSKSINLPETHEVVRLLRTLIEYACNDAIIITETNIPNIENMSYFGNQNEAHWIYNFSLPPLLVNTLLTGNSHHLRQWLMSMPSAMDGTAYFNFIASHDGIGLRPLEGLLSNDEEQALIQTLQGFGGKISWRALSENESKPYEINIALYDALKGTVEGEDAYNFERFICAHLIMMGLQGVPAFYVHSLLATGNDYQRYFNSGHNRCINRHQWQYKDLKPLLDNKENQHHQVFFALKSLIQLRAQQPAFHPNADQHVLYLGDDYLSFSRSCHDKTQFIYCISNITAHTKQLSVNSINLEHDTQFTDLISGIKLSEEQDALILAPYQTVWLSN
ncbi:MAG: sugar phosphorylase [Pseudomonadales bacterium]|nr:sugar phosphorylase [Pseudomonadales bacterium]